MQIPKYGVCDSRARRIAASLPSIPRAPKPPGMIIASAVASRSGGVLRVQPLGVDIIDFDFDRGVNARVLQRLGQRFVRIRQIDILPDHRDFRSLRPLLRARANRPPLRQIRRRRFDLQALANGGGESAFAVFDRQRIQIFHIGRGENALFAQVAKKRDFAPMLGRQYARHAAKQKIRLHADLAQRLDRMLRRLGFGLARRADKRQQRHVHKAQIRPRQFEPHLPRRLQKRQRFNVAHGAADFDDDDLVVGRKRAADETFNLVRDMRNHLHRAAHIIALPLFADHRFVNLPGREVVFARHLARDKPLVMPQIQIGFRAVGGHEDLAVLIRIHRPRIDIDIRVEFEEIDFDPARLQRRAQRSRRDSLAERRDDSAGDNHELRRRRHCGIIANYSPAVARARNLNPRRV